MKGGWAKIPWLAAGVLAIGFLSAGEPGVRVAFERELYVLRRGEPVGLRLVVSSGGEPGVPGGLLGYGWRVRFEPGFAGGEAPGLRLPPELDFDLGRSEATVIFGDASVGALGTVDLEAGAGPWLGEELAVLEVDTAGAAVGRYRIAVERFHAGTAVTDFADGNRGAIDERLTFSGADLVVVPEEPPRLAIRGVAGGVVTLEFDVVPGLIHEVEASDDPGDPASWAVLPGAPHDSGRVDVPVSGRARFFRLRLVL